MTSHLTTAAQALTRRGVFVLSGGLAASLVSHGAAAADPLGIDQLKGKVVYLDFWASWCGPCKLSFPFMKDLQETYSSRGLVILTVNLDHDRHKAEFFLNQIGASLPVIYDPSGVVAGKYQIREMPTSMVIGRDGAVRYVHKGFHSDQSQEYRDHVARVLEERS